MRHHSESGRTCLHILVGKLKTIGNLLIFIQYFGVIGCFSCTSSLPNLMSFYSHQVLTENIAFSCRIESFPNQIENFPEQFGWENYRFLLRNFSFWFGNSHCSFYSTHDRNIPDPAGSNCPSNIIPLVRLPALIWADLFAQVSRWSESPRLRSDGNRHQNRTGRIRHDSWNVDDLRGSAKKFRQFHLPTFQSRFSQRSPSRSQR